MFHKVNKSGRLCIKIVFICFLIIITNKQIFSQFNFNYNDSLTVIKNSQYLEKAWGGGLNYTQFSTIDFDFDGDLDLLCFDRSADQIRLFENVNDHYKQVYQVSDLFPEDIRYRAFCIDYDMDGKNDLFTYGIGGIKVYKNIGSLMDGLQWELTKEVLTSDHWGIELNLYVSSADIPAIVDVDNDNDLDVLTYHIGGEYLQYHKNISQELYGNSDSLVFQLKNECWGGYREDNNTNSVTLNDQSSPCQEGNIPNAERQGKNSNKEHAGSTITAIDYDGSGVLDLILGDVSHQNMIFLLNGGEEVNTNSQMISQDIFFPSNTTPINLNLFPAAFYLDVDFDGFNDLIISPNAKNVSENVQSCWKYKNIGDNSNHIFLYETNAFIQSEMIENGTGSIPVFADVNGDGLEDMFISSFYRYKPILNKESAIHFYLNTGTLSNPEFTFIDNDFQNLSNLNLGLRLVPSFGDLNGDGKLDLIIGQENGTLVYLKNTSLGSNISFDAPILNYQDNTGNIIDVGQYSSPQLFDLDRDNLLDLMLGNKNGEIIYYKNIGTISSPKFQLFNSVLGNINVSDGSPDGYSVPHFFRYGDSLNLILGSYDGKIHFYKNISYSNNDGDIVLTDINDNFLGLNTTLGKYSAAWINDMDNDGNLDLYLGQDLGGIFRLENDINGNLGLNGNAEDETIIKFYPNPFTSELNIELLKASDVKIIDCLGNIISQFTNKQTFLINTSSWAKGIYFIQIGHSKNKLYRCVKI